MKPLAILLLLNVAAGADDLFPQAFPKDRYAETIGRSPFVLETKIVEAAAPPQNVFANLYLRSVSKADGKDYVLIQRLGEERPMKPFIGTEPGDDGFALKSVRVGDNYRLTKVVLQKGSDIGEIGFKEDSINTPPPAVAPPGRGPVQPGMFPKPGMTAAPPMPLARAPQILPSQPSQAVPRPGAVPLPAPQPIQVPQMPANSQRGPRLRQGVINN